MKKFFLISLMTLCTCVMAWGATHEVSTYDELKALVPGFSTNPLAAGDVVKLTSTIESSNSIQWYVSGAFTLDLNGYDLKVNGFDLLGWEGSGEVTITNGRILPYNASTEYALKFTNSVIYDYVIDKVEIGAGSKAALQVRSATSLTIQGTCSIPSIELAGNFPMTNQNTLNTSIINSGYKLNLTNNGTFTFGANTLYSSTTAPTITNNGTIAIEAGAAFTNAAWAVVSSYKNSAHVAETWAMSSSVLGQKIFASTPTHVAKIGSVEYASFDAAFLDARLTGGSQTIQLLSDANLLKYFDFGNNTVDITVDLNNHTLAMGNNYIYHGSLNGFGAVPSQKLAFENGTITSNVSGPIFKLSPTRNFIPELSLNNVTLTNTYNQSDAMISKRGIGIETSGKAKIALLGTTTGTVKLTSLSNLSSFDFNNEAQCHVYVFGSTSTTVALTQYIDDNTLLDKFGATNAWWDIQQGFILPAIKDNYTSHITGTVADNTEEVGPAGSKVPHYRITEAGTPVVATVNGANYYNFFEALDASSETYPAILQTNVSVSGLSAHNGQNRYLDLNGHNVEQTAINLEMNRIENGQLHFLGNGTVTTKAPFYIFGSSDASAEDYSVLEIAAGVTVTYDASFENYAIWVAENASNTAYGVRVNIAGRVNSDVGGAYINGKIKTASEHAPIFNITGTLNADHAGIYAAGYGIWNISGTVNGNDAFGIGIKAGKLNVTNNAVIYGGATSEFERVDAFGNGMNISGATLQIESNGSYGGNMEIVIADNATLSSANNTYAIYEYVDKYDSPTKVKSIAVTGGKFQGGILISQALAAKGGFVSGGKWSKDISANIKAGENLSLLNNTDEDKTTYPYIVAVPAPEQEADYAEKDASNNAVLTNAASESAAESYTSGNVGNDPDVITTKETNPVVVSENTDVVATEAAPIVEVKKVTVDNDAQLTVTEGATLMVGAGAVTLDENSSNGLTVEAGAALVVEGLVYGSTEDNFVIEGEEDKSGIVLFSPETEFIREDHPTATYRFTSKSFRDGSKWVYQRFGMPSFDGTVTVKSGNLDVNSYICTWDYAADDWGAWSPKIPAAGLIYNGDNKAVPFQCYQLGSTNAKDAPVTYDFIVELMGNANAPLNFKAGWNPYANSYTAPIDIKEFLTDVIANNGSDILATIYLYKDLGNDTYTWQGINLSNVGKTYRVRENGAMVKKTYDASIEPMQAFIMKLSNGDDATTDINYLNNVYNPAMGIDRPASAPARSRASYNEMQIGAYNDMYWDNISVMEGEQFSAAEDNGYDAPKYDHNKGLSLYVINGEQHMERMATDNADGMFIGINAPVAGTYTLDFSGIEGMNYSLIDMTNNTVVEIVEDGQYNFYAEAGQNDYRFQLVAPARVPTAIESTGVKADVKGVYSISGQYLGEDINALPKGVYIINGAKVVK